MSSRSLAWLAGLTIMLGAARAGAQAQGEAKPSRPAAPALAPGATPPPVFAPGATPGAPAYGPYAAPPPGYFVPYWLTPYTPMKRHSSKMIAAGIVLISVGSVGLIAGPSMYAAGADGQLIFPPCLPEGPCEPTRDQNKALLVGGIAMIITSGLAVAAGIPVLVIGAKKEPDLGAAFVPELRASPGGAAMAWRF